MTYADWMWMSVCLALAGAATLLLIYDFRPRKYEEPRCQRCGRRNE